MIKSAPKVISIQSHVVYGYAGNKSAVFPMQCLGIDVSPVNTVQLSNHSGYDTKGGTFFTAEQINSVLSGFEKNNFFKMHSAILSGYIGDSDIANIIAETLTKMKKHHKKTIYCCDPVFGDFLKNGDGYIYATKDHPRIFNDLLIPLADIVTPNLFELETLTKTKIKNKHDLKNACDKLVGSHDKKDQVILVTSCCFNKDKTGIALYQNNSISFFESKIYQVEPMVRGSGDATASIFLAHILNGFDFISAASKTIKILENIFKTTSKLCKDELALIESRKYII